MWNFNSSPTVKKKKSIDCSFDWFFFQKKSLIWTLIWRYCARNIWFELWFDSNFGRDNWYKHWIENFCSKDLWFEVWFENNLLGIIDLNFDLILFHYRIFDLFIDLRYYWNFILIWTLIWRKFFLEVFDLILDWFISLNKNIGWYLICLKI